MTIRNISEKRIIFCPNCSLDISIRKIFKENKILLEYIFCPECGVKIEFENYFSKNEDVFNLSEKLYDKNELNKALEMIFDENRISIAFKKQLSFLISRMTLEHLFLK